MKHLFLYIVCLLTFFNSIAAALQEPQFPDDFKGTETRKYWADYLDNKDYDLTFWQSLNIFYEVGTYLYQKYPMEQIEADDFIEKIRPFFPGDTDDGLRKKQTYLINTASLYKLGKDTYTKIAKKYLVPHAYRKVHDESEYDHPGEVSYIPTADDEYVKVYNFKKFLSYSSNIDELNAISDFERNDAKNENVLTQIDRIIEKIDWKKVWFYGTLYENPIFSKLGIGEMQFDDAAGVRLLAQDKYTNRRKQFDFGLQIFINPKYFVLANNLSEDRLKPQITFANSQNVAEAQILYPMPHKANILPQAHKYIGSVMLPIRVTVQNPDESIDLNAQVHLTLCDTKFNCRPHNFETKIHTDVKGPDKLYNTTETLFFNVINSIPTNHPKHLTLRQFTTIETPNGEELYLNMTTDKRVRTLEAYIENNEGYTQFSEPQYIINKDSFDVYFKPLPDSKDIDLDNTDYTVSIKLNGKYKYRDNLVPNTIATVAVKNSPTLFKTVLSAITSGIMLNFMPCCIPFILLLLLIFIRTSKQDRTILKPLQISTLKGSIVGILGVTLLFGSKKLSHDYMIWGMQFSCLPLLCCLLFGFVVLLKFLPKISAQLSDAATSKRHSDIFFAYGLIIGALVYISASPYLSELMNIAVASSGTMMLIISAGLAVGFISVQYLMICLSNHPQVWHMLSKNPKDVIRYIRIALYITLLWLLLLVAFQCTFGRLLSLTALILLWMFLCTICSKYFDYLDTGIWDESITLKHLQKIRFGCVVFMLLLSAIFITAGIKITDVNQATEQTAATNDTQIKDLLQQNKKVLLVINADWCFKCQISKHWTINSLIRERWQNTEIIYENNIQAIKQYMQKHNQFALPFYILYTPIYPHGIVLSADADVNDFENIIE